MLSEREIQENPKKEEWALVNVKSSERRILKGVRSLKEFISTLGDEEKSTWIVYAFGSRVPFRIEGPRLRPMLDQERRSWPSSIAEVELTKSSASPSLVKKSSLYNFLGTPDRREFVRLSKAFKVSLVSGKRSFATFTKDISLGGLLLAERPSRDFHFPYLKVRLEGPDNETLEIPVVFAGNSEVEQRRIEYIKLDDTNKALLSRWLEIDEALKRKAA